MAILYLVGIIVHSSSLPLVKPDGEHQVRKIHLSVVEIGEGREFTNKEFLIQSLTSGSHQLATWLKLLEEG